MRSAGPGATAHPGGRTAGCQRGPRSPTRPAALWAPGLQLGQGQPAPRKQEDTGGPPAVPSSGSSTKPGWPGTLLSGVTRAWKWGSQLAGGDPLS